MKDFAYWALNHAETLGVTYADVRVIDTRERYVSTKNGKVGQATIAESLGLGIRVLTNGAWGFASTDTLSRDGVESAATRAVAIARASALVKQHDVLLVPEQKFEATWETPLQRDPFSTTIEENIALLMRADDEMRRVNGITLAEAALHFKRQEQFFASTIGSASPATSFMRPGSTASTTPVPGAERASSALPPRPGATVRSASTT